MKGRKTLIILFSTMLTTIFTSLLMLPTTHADEIRFPVPCYEGEELQKVRQWEKQWAGKRIDAGSVDGVKEYLPEEYYKLIKNPEWGSYYWFDILPYKEIPPTKGDIAFTKKYAGSCTIDENEVLQNYISGVPFPNPSSAIEIAYNYDNMNAGDNLDSYSVVWMIDAKRKYDRTMILKGHMLWCAGRRDIEPVPEFLPNTKQIYRATHGFYEEPASYKGNHSIQIKWKDRSRDWGSWMFMSATRRVNRYSTAQRQSSLGGTDVTSDDDFIYSWNIPANTYKLLGRKDLLLSRHQDFESLRKNHKEGEALFPGEKRERINTYMIEVISKDPNYVYSKQIWYVDPETWWIRYSDKYDKRGRMWKIFETLGYVLTSKYDGQKVPQMCFMHVIDVQRKHATGTAGNAKVGLTSKYFKPEFYEPRALLKYGY